MKLAMPYRPFRSQSRVEFIKQKFEGSFSEQNEPTPLKQTSVTIPCASNLLQDIKVSNLEKKSVDLKIESDLKHSFGNKNEGKAVIKRSPAFRREKLGCTKSLSQTSPEESVTSRKLECKTNSAEVQEKILNSVDVVHVNTWNDFKRSKTDTNLLKYCSSRIKDKEFFCKDPKNDEISNSLVKIRSEQIECEADKNVSPQYSIVKKKESKSTANKNETVSLKFSESIRKALESPLPKGPPPKKPPRTFCHIPVTQAVCHTNTTQKLTVSTNSDIPKLKSKLEKLEKIIQIHGAGSQENKSKVDFEKQVKNIKVTEEAGSYQTCLPISHCLNQGTKVQNSNKLSKAKSEFYLQINEPDLKLIESFRKDKDCLLGFTCDAVPVKKSTAETIYDLPCVNKKNSFETFGKCSKDLKESVNSIKAEGLHYMCTDVISQVSKHPNYLPEVVESEKQSGISISKSDFLPSMHKQKSSSLSRIDNVKELVNDIKMDKGNEKKNKLKDVKELPCPLTYREKSGQHNSELSTMDPDCSEMKNNHRAEETISQMTAKRKVYVNRVSSKLVNQVPLWKNKNRNSYKHLFECCLLVGLTLCESKQNVPYIKNIFPPETKPPPLIESLCFPDASLWPPTFESHHEEQYYTLVVTNENGERKFGYCRRVLPEGGHVCLPLAYCIITPHRAGGFFYKVLEELESRHGSPGLDKFIKQLYESEFPGPGERLKLKEILEEVTRTSRLDSDICFSSTLVRRPPDLRLEEKDLTQLFQHLQLSVFLKVFSSLLHERKVLLLSNSLRNLSSCTEALQSILLPFSWQHTYIPVLPVHLIEMCEAPTPYVIGLLKPRNVEKSLTNINFEDGILVDLDDSKILKCCGDEGSILPSRFIRDLKTALNLAMTATDLLSESVRSVLISDAFIRFFVQACGNYSKFIQDLPNGGRIFQKDAFIKSSASNTTQSFLDWFTETAMFSSFIQERLQGDEEDVLVKLFRRRAMEYSEESFKDSAVLLKNYRVINKKVRTLGDKIKDFTSFTK